jgi:hypothetical protein
MQDRLKGRGHTKCSPRSSRFWNNLLSRNYGGEQDPHRVSCQQRRISEIMDVMMGRA